MPRGYAVIGDLAHDRVREADTCTCNHCNAIVMMHDRQGKPRANVLVHCHGCDRHICVRCAETPKCVPLEKRIEMIESRARLRAAIGG